MSEPSLKGQKGRASSSSSQEKSSPQQEPRNKENDGKECPRDSSKSAAPGPPISSLKPSVKASKRALFDLIKNYKKDGTDMKKFMERVIELVKEDQQNVTRRFWYASIEPDGDPPIYEIEGAPKDAEGYVSPVLLTCQFGLYEVLLYLLDHGGDPNDQFGIDACQVSSAQAAIDGGHLDCVRLLHERGVDIGKSYGLDKGNMANCAVYSGNVELLKFLTSINVGPVDEGTVSRVEREWPPWYELPKKKVSDSMLEAIKDNQATVKRRGLKGYG